MEHVSCDIGKPPKNRKDDVVVPSRSIHVIVLLQQLQYHQIAQQALMHNEQEGEVEAYIFRVVQSHP